MYAARLQTSAKNKV